MIIMLVLSANKIGLDISDINVGRSITYSRKNNSPSIEPCGTLCFHWLPFRKIFHGTII